MKRSAWLMFWVGAISAAGCGQVIAPMSDSDADSGVVADAGSDDAAVADGPEITPASTPIAACDPQRVWWSADMNSGVPALHRYFGFSPNGGMVFVSHGAYRGTGTYMRTRTGESMMTDPDGWQVLDRDAHWGREVVRLDDGSVQVNTVLTRRTLAALPTDQVTYAADATLSPDAALVVTANCGGDGITLRGFQAEGGAAQGVATFQSTQCPGWDSTAPLAIAGRDGTALGAFPSDGAVYRIDLATGQNTHAQITPSVTDPNVNYDGGPIVNIVPSPDGTRIATVAVDGQVRVLSLPGLELVGASIPAGKNLVNTNLYAPSYLLSPLAWTPSSDALAYLRPDGRIGIVRFADGAMHTAALQPDDGWPGEPGRTFPLAALAFSPDGTMLAASFDGGTALWSCPGHAFPAPSGELVVTLAAPGDATVGTAITLEATHMGTENVHSHQFFVDGVALAPASLERTIAWTPSSAGAHQVKVVIDDGTNTGSAVAVVTAD